MAKIKENWLSILLAVVVILSMIFSALLWTNSLGYEWIANNDSEKAPHSGQPCSQSAISICQRR